MLNGVGRVNNTKPNVSLLISILNNVEQHALSRNFIMMRITCGEESPLKIALCDCHCSRSGSHQPHFKRFSGNPGRVTVRALRCFGST